MEKIMWNKFFIIFIYLSLILCKTVLKGQVNFELQGFYKKGNVTLIIRNKSKDTLFMQRLCYKLIDDEMLPNKYYKINTDTLSIYLNDTISIGIKDGIEKPKPVLWATCPIIPGDERKFKFKIKRSRDKIRYVYINHEKFFIHGRIM